MSPEVIIDIIADIAQIAAAIAVLATTQYVRKQVKLQTRDVENDERRYMRESLTVIHETLQDPDFRDARHAFFSGPHRKEYSDLESEERNSARRILSVYGLVGRMEKHQAVEKELLKDYWYASLIRDWDRLENFVSGERMRAGNGALFKETEQMVSRWTKDDAA